MESLVGISSSCLAFPPSFESRWSPFAVKPRRNVQIVKFEKLLYPKVQIAFKTLRQSSVRIGIDIAVATLETASPLNAPLAGLTTGQTQEFHELPSGLKLEVIVQNAGQGLPKKPSPLVFIHGSYHAAWCWAYWWMPFFSAKGYDCYAVSFLGQGASDVPQAAVAGTPDTHARDIAHFIRHNLSSPPVIIAHSFGGLVIQCFLSNISSTASPTTDNLEEFCPRPGGVVFACSTPPTGNGPMVKRFLKKDLIASIKITLGFAAKLLCTSVSLCRDCLFSPDIPEIELKEYQKLMKRSSRVPIFDVRTISDSLPRTRPPQNSPPALVLHAENDYIVDAQGSQETAEWCGTNSVVLPGIAHDVMLDVQWEQAAQNVLSWLREHDL